MEIFSGAFLVILGFVLSEVKSSRTSTKRVQALKRMLREELGTILNQIPDREDIIKQVITRLNQYKILSGISVRAPRVMYEHLFPELSEELNAKERNSVHYIYEYTRMTDNALEGYEAALRQELMLAGSRDPYKDKAIVFTEILKAQGRLRDLIEHHLAGDPIDVHRYVSTETS